MKLLMFMLCALSGASLVCGKPAVNKAAGSKAQRAILLVSPEAAAKVLLMKDFFPVFVNDDGDSSFTDNKRRSVMGFIPSVQTIAAFNDLNTAAAKTWTATSATAAPPAASPEVSPASGTGLAGSFSGFVPDPATIAALNDLNKINLDAWMPAAAPVEPAALPSETEIGVAPQLRQLFM